MNARALTVVLVLGLWSCGVATSELGGDADSWGTSSAALAFSESDQTAVLAFVNDAATTQALLDGEVGLDARAAKNIVTARNGVDGLYPSPDDVPFVSLVALDAVVYVGDTALTKLRDFALAHPPALPELVEGVAFSSSQVSAVVWGVNQATLETLDVAVGLDARAAQQLVAARPFSSVTQMGAVAYVGPTALEALRAYAVQWAAQRGAGTAGLEGTWDGVAFDADTAAAALSAAQTASLEQLLAAALPSSGARAMVAGRPYASLAQVAAVSGVGPATMTALHAYAASLLASGGDPTPPGGTGSVADGEDCHATAECQPGLLCAGLSVMTTGFCRPLWMAGTFSSSTVLAIPDGSATGIESSVLVSGLASVPEDIIVHLDIVHPRKTDLRITLVQPSSAESIVWEVDSAGDARVSPRQAERDSDVNGTWTLYVWDTRTGAVGTLNGWSLELTSRYD